MILFHNKKARGDRCHSAQGQSGDQDVGKHKQPLSSGANCPARSKGIHLVPEQSSWRPGGLYPAAGEGRPQQWRENRQGRVGKEHLRKNSSEGPRLHNGGVCGREGKYSCFLRRLQEITSGREKQGSSWIKKREKKRRGLGWGVREGESRILERQGN